MKIYLLFFLVYCLLFQSCSSGTDTSHLDTSATTQNARCNDKLSVTNKDTIPTTEKFATGVIIDQVICRNDASQNYSLYLPKNYAVDKIYPVLYIFDAHGDGKLPITFYKDLAEKYGYILVGSNNSKNGTTWEDSKSIAEKLFTDVQSRISVNTQRIYVLGFSGGARVANGLAITNGIINGAICCGAAAPAVNSTSPRSNYSFIGIAGNKDFNYTEMRKYDMVDLAGYKLKHSMISFDGKHEWPPKEIMEQAIWWMELNEMRKTSSYKNDSLIAIHVKPILKQIEILKQKNKSYELYELCKKTINFYENVIDLTDCINTWRSLQGNAEVDKALKHEENIWKQEDVLKQFYVTSLQTKNFEWWKQDIVSLNQKIKTGKDKEETLMFARSLNYLSLACYMQASGMLKQNNIKAAEFYSKLYVLIDPTNKEAYYITASINAINGSNKMAIESLNESIKNGFTDLKRLEEDSVFFKMKDDVGFMKVLKLIQK